MKNIKSKIKELCITNLGGIFVGFVMVLPLLSLIRTIYDSFIFIYCWFFTSMLIIALVMYINKNKGNEKEI